MSDLFKIQPTTPCSLRLAKQKIARVKLEDRLDIPMFSSDTNSHFLFSEIYQNYYAETLKLVLHFEKNCREAEDIVQDIFIRLFQQGEKLSMIESIPAYLCTCVRNHLISRKRKQKVELIGEFSPCILSEEISADEQLGYKFTSAFLEKAIAKLSKRQREVLTMSRIIGMTHKQIADQLGIKTFTVNEHICEALQNLRKVMLQYNRE